MLPRQAHPTSGQRIDGTVIEEVIRSQRDEPEPAETVCRTELLVQYALNGLLEERRPGRVAGRDPGRVALEEEVHPGRRRLRRLRDGVGLRCAVSHNPSHACPLSL